MTALFLKLVNMSITASWLVLAVVLLRLLLKRAPKALHCVLWALVAIRLICPFTLESNVSLVPRQEPISVQTFHAEPVEPSPRVEYEVVIHEDPVGGFPVSEPVMHVTHTGGPFPFLHWLTGIWLVGMALLLIWAAESYLRIRRQVAPSVFVGNGVWICDHIDTPFILGLIRPRIYLPSGLMGRDADHVLAHERSHLKRKDHWWKPLGFLLLSIYWFNPVMWLAYILLCRDIEMACDEKVIKELGTEEKKSYSTALLNCSLPRHQIAACPLAFGEVGVKHRVKNVLHYKKPAFWIVLIAAILSIIAAVCLLTDPAEGMYLYEIDDSRNYSDLFTNTDDIYLVREGEEFPVDHPETLLQVLDDVTVRELPVNRSREETRDKTNRIHIRGNTWLNFSYNYKHVWIDNGLKPTYTYRVLKPEILRDVFEILTGERLQATAENVTPTGMTLVYAPKKVYDSDKLLFVNNYWLERFDGTAWNKVSMLPEVGVGKIAVSSTTKEQHRHQLDWFAVYGSLYRGTYRICEEFVFQDVGITCNVYAEFTIGEDQNMIPWFDVDLNSGLTYPRGKDIITVPGVEGMILWFRQESGATDYQEQILVQMEDGYEPVISAENIRNVYLTDLTGDGIPEICATVYDYEPEYNRHIVVYDPANHIGRTLESPGQLMYDLTCRDDTLLVMVRQDSLGSILQIGHLALVPDDSADGFSLQILPLDESLRELTQTITCIDVYNRKMVCLSGIEEVEAMTVLLRDLKTNVTPVSASELEECRGDDFGWGYITVNYDLGSKRLNFSSDFRYLWEDSSEIGYLVQRPETLHAFVEQLTDGVRNQETSGEPFATMDTPWDWCAGLHTGAITSASMDVLLYDIGNKSGYTGGALSRSTLEELIAVLNRIPESAFQYVPTVIPKSYSDVSRVEDQVAVTITLKDTVNDLLVMIRTNENRIELFTTNEPEKTKDEYRHVYFESLKLWSVESPELAALLDAYFENPPVITYTVGAEYNWQPPVEITAGDFSLTLRLIEGWEYEEYSNRQSSGIRCRPEDVEEGWICFSFWPGQYEPKEEERYFAEGSWYGYTSVTSWPASVQSPQGFSTYGHIWSYKKYVMNSGDYAVINDGADSWFLEYEDQIEDMLTLSQFQEGNADG